MIANLKIFGYRIGLQFTYRKEGTNEVIGYTNRTEDGYYVVTIDYDRLKLEWILPELKRLQKDFDLGDFYVFESSNDKFHAVCFDKLTYNQFVRVLKNSSVDENYIYVSSKWGLRLWTLRLTDKEKMPIKFIKRIKGEGYHNQSRAHIKMIKKLYPELQFNYRFCDQSDQVVFSKYMI